MRDGGVLADTWILDLDGMVCCQVAGGSDVSTTPAARASGAMCTGVRGVWMHGGRQGYA